MQPVFEEIGYFWWHGEEVLKGKRFPSVFSNGKISVDMNGRIDLELYSELNQLKGEQRQPRSIGVGDPLNKYTKEKYIQGYLISNDKNVLLTDISDLDLTNSQHYVSNNMLMQPFPFVMKDELPVFDKIRLSLSGLQNWFSLDGFLLSHTAKELKIEYKKPDDLQFCSDNAELTLEFGCSAKMKTKHSSGGPSVTLNETVSLIFRAKSPMKMEEIKKVHRRFEEFFSLLTNTFCRLDWPVIMFEDRKFSDIFFFEVRAKQEFNIEHNRLPVTFQQVKEDFGKLFFDWQKGYDQYGPAFYLYFAVMGRNDLYLEHQFVTLIWAIETLHRRKNKTNQYKDEKYKIEKILSKITDPVEKEWLNARLEFAYEPRLADRIFETLNFADLFEDEKLRRFCKKCARLRNQVSHYGASPSQLIEINEALLTLVHAVLLNEIGICPPSIKTWLFEGVASWGFKVAFERVKLIDPVLQQAPSIK